VTDAWITTKVKADLLATENVSGLDIKVETVDGTVMLSGFAKNMNEKRMAGEIAMGVNGVKSVKNEIAVRP